MEISGGFSKPQHDRDPPSRQPARRGASRYRATAVVEPAGTVDLFALSPGETEPDKLRVVKASGG